MPLSYLGTGYYEYLSSSFTYLGIYKQKIAGKIYQDEQATVWAEQDNVLLLLGESGLADCYPYNFWKSWHT